MNLLQLGKRTNAPKISKQMYVVHAGSGTMSIPRARVGFRTLCVLARFSRPLGVLHARSITFPHSTPSLTQCVLFLFFRTVPIIPSPISTLSPRRSADVIALAPVAPPNLWGVLYPFPRLPSFACGFLPYHVF